MIWWERGGTPLLPLQTAKHGELSEPALLEPPARKVCVLLDTQGKEVAPIPIFTISDFTSPLKKISGRPSRQLLVFRWKMMHNSKIHLLLSVSIFFGVYSFPSFSARLQKQCFENTSTFLLNFNNHQFQTQFRRLTTLRLKCAPLYHLPPKQPWNSH